MKSIQCGEVGVAHRDFHRTNFHNDFHIYNYSLNVYFGKSWLFKTWASQLVPKIVWGHISKNLGELTIPPNGLGTILSEITFDIKSFYEALIFDLSDFIYLLVILVDYSSYNF